MSEIGSGEILINNQKDQEPIIKVIPRITEISQKVEVSGFGKNESFVRRTIESVGLPLDNITKITVKKVDDGKLPEFGELAFSSDFENLSKKDRLGVIIHDLALKDSPFEEENIRLYGSKENMEKAAENVRKVVKQTKESGVFLDKEHEKVFKRFENDEIDEDKVLKETFAEMVKLRYSDPVGPRRSLLIQNKDTKEEISDELDNTILNLIPHLNSKKELDDFMTNFNLEFRTPLERITLKNLTPEKRIELLSAGTLWMLETLYHEASIHPDKTLASLVYRSLPPPPLPTEPTMKFLVDSIGDIWEVSAGTMALRIGFVALNEVLKTDAVKNIQTKVLENEKIKNFAGKFVGSEKIEELSKGADLEISDDACFWASLITTATITASHSLGYISLFGINDHMGAPVPNMLIGQAAAAVVLVASHYAGKYHESVKDIAIKVGQKINKVVSLNLSTPPNTTTNVNKSVVT